jgi:hypothetical protein
MDFLLYQQNHKKLSAFLGLSAAFPVADNHSKSTRAQE